MTTETQAAIAGDRIGPTGPNTQPLLTGDGVLAFALHMAGTPFVDDNMWVVNYYTTDILRKLGYSGMSMREGALQAVKDGKPGVIRFMLQNPTNEVRAAYLEQQKEVDDGEGLAKDVLRDLLTDFKSGARAYDETVARLVCLILKLRIRFMNGWKEVVPLLSVEDGKQPRAATGLDGVRTVEMGGFKFISANASKATRERMGL